MQAASKFLFQQGQSVRGALLQHLAPRSTPLVNAGLWQQVRHQSPQAAVAQEDDDDDFENSTIEDILSTKGAKEKGSTLFCSTEDLVYDAVKAMVANNVGALLVMGPDSKKVAGIVTERDYLRKIIVQGRSSKSTKVGDIMTEENRLITVTPKTKVLQAMQLMTENRIRHIPVTESKKMLGMVSIGDVVRAVVDEHRQEVKRLNTYIRGDYSG